MDRYCTVQSMYQLPVTDVCPTHRTVCCCWAAAATAGFTATEPRPAMPPKPASTRPEAVPERASSHPIPSQLPGLHLSPIQPSLNIRATPRYDMTDASSSTGLLLASLPLPLPRRDETDCDSASFGRSTARARLRMHTLPVTQAYSAPATGLAWATQAPLGSHHRVLALLPPGTGRPDRLTGMACRRAGVQGAATLNRSGKGAPLRA